VRDPSCRVFLSPEEAQLQDLNHEQHQKEHGGEGRAVAQLAMREGALE
jgi:hypothetical protein